MAVWKTIQEFPNYEVSDDGRVRSVGGLRTFGNNTRFAPGIERKLSTKANGYQQVTLYEQGRPSNHYVHRLVAGAFIPNPRNLLDVNHMHRDGNKTRNDAANLEWVSRRENISHCKTILIGKAPIGTRHGMAKLSESDVFEIRNAASPRKELAARFGVTTSTIDLIINRRTWRHLGT